jgi:dipeptidase D
MINLDNEDIKKCEIGCAGVNNEVFSIDIKTEKFLKPSAVKFTIEGLLGGHSGAYIGNLRGNAIKLGFEILYQAMSQNIKINLLHCASSIPLNVIPSEFEIIIDINDNDMKKFEDIATTYLKKYQNIYTEEKNIKFHFQKITDFSSYSNSYISAEITSKIINFFAAIPDGVLLYNEKLQMYEISYNLAQITMKENIMQFGYSLRSTNVNAHVHFKQKISALLDLGNLSWKSLETQSSSVA